MIISKDLIPIKYRDGLPRWLGGEESPLTNGGDARDSGSTPWSGRSPGVENSTRLQYPCLENPMDRGAWRGTAHGVRVAESDTTEHIALGVVQILVAGETEIKTQ